MRRAIVVVLVLLCSGCTNAAPSPSAGDQVIAQVGPTAITNDLFQVRLTSALASVTLAGGPTNNPTMRSQVRASVLRSLIIDTIIGQEAAASGVAATDAEIQAQVRADVSAAGGTSQLQSRLASLGGSMAQLHDEIASSLDEQKLEDLFARQRALEIEQKLAAGGSFAALATQYSDDAATNAKGGEQGAVPHRGGQGGRGDPGAGDAVGDAAGGARQARGILEGHHCVPGRGEEAPEGGGGRGALVHL